MRGIVGVGDEAGVGIGYFLQLADAVVVEQRHQGADGAALHESLADVGVRTPTCCTMRLTALVNKSNRGLSGLSPISSA
jgi:hypothetical protein